MQPGSHLASMYIINSQHSVYLGDVSHETFLFGERYKIFLSVFSAWIASSQVPRCQGGTERNEHLLSAFWSI